MAGCAPGYGDASLTTGEVGVIAVVGSGVRVGGMRVGAAVEVWVGCGVGVGPCPRRQAVSARIANRIITHTSQFALNLKSLHQWKNHIIEIEPVKRRMNQYSSKTSPGVPHGEQNLA